jgi:hypothetical protein
MTLSILGFYMMLRLNDTQRNNALHYAECHYAESCVLFTVMLSVIMLSVVMLSVVAPRTKTLTALVNGAKAFCKMSLNLMTFSIEFILSIAVIVHR